jgi:hypothetical protein
MTTELGRGGVFGGLGGLGYVIELLVGATTVVLGCIGVLLCTLGRNGSLESAFIEREYSASEDRPLSGQVTIRLEPEYFRLFRRHRCVVTIRGAPEDAREKDREAWADDDG